MMLRALDLFSGAGGATRGLQQAGYHVTGVDIRPQPHYIGDASCQGDAFDWLARDLSAFDLIWASPKCQGHSVLTPARFKANHEIQLPRVLDMLSAQPIPYIVENVEGTQVYMRNPIMLCGSMFGLEVWRHRWFELGNTDAFFLLPPCNHSEPPVLVSGRGMRRVERAVIRRRLVRLRQRWADSLDLLRAGASPLRPPERRIQRLLALPFLFVRHQQWTQCSVHLPAALTAEQRLRLPLWPRLL